MGEIIVFSRNPIACRTTGNIRMEAAVSEGGYCYVLSVGECSDGYIDSTLNFVFEGIVQSIVVNRLSLGGNIGGDPEVSEFFSQKLSAYLYITGSRNKIDNIVKTLLRESSIINIEGIVNFRLRELSMDISAFFDMLFYEYKVQKQYDDFVSLVRNYIELESPKESVVHIVFRRSGFILYNAKKANITYQALKKYKKDPDFPEGSLNDFLISSLLYFLPKSIVLHIEDKFLKGSPSDTNTRIIETIKTIFKERVISCEHSGCEFCGCEATFDRFPEYI